MPWRPLAVCLALLLALLVLLHSDSAVHEHTAAKLLAKLAWKNASVRPPLLLVLVLGGWGWVVSVCNRAGLDVERVLNGRTQAPRETYHAALTLLCLLLSMRLLHLVASETAGVVWRPWLTANVLLHGLFLVLALLPCDVFFGNSRISLLRAVWDSVIAPCAPVTFWHVLVADYMTSLAKAFSDLQLTACISYRIFAYSPEATYVRSTDLWHESCAAPPPRHVGCNVKFQSGHFSPCGRSHINSQLLPPLRDGPGMTHALTQRGTRYSWRHPSGGD